MLEGNKNAHANGIYSAVHGLCGMISRSPFADTASGRISGSLVLQALAIRVSYKLGCFFTITQSNHNATLNLFCRFATGLQAACYFTTDGRNRPSAPPTSKLADPHRRLYGHRTL